MGVLMAVLFCLIIFDHFRLTSRVSTLEQTVNQLRDDADKLQDSLPKPRPH